MPFKLDRSVAHTVQCVTFVQFRIVHPMANNPGTLSVSDQQAPLDAASKAPVDANQTIM